MKKFLIVILTLFFSLSLVSCGESGVLESSKTYEVNGAVTSLDVEINASQLIIEESTAFFVESNLKYLTVTVENGVLNLHEKPPFPIKPSYDHPTLTLYIPTNTVFEEIELEFFVELGQEDIIHLLFCFRERTDIYPSRKTAVQ